MRPLQSEPGHRTVIPARQVKGWPGRLFGLLLGTLLGGWYGSLQEDAADQRMLARGFATIDHPPVLTIFFALVGASIGVLTIPFIGAQAVALLEQKPRVKIRQWMLIVAVFAISLSSGRALREASFESVVFGIICLIAAIPMLAILIDFIRTLRSHE